MYSTVSMTTPHHWEFLTKQLGADVVKHCIQPFLLPSIGATPKVLMDLVIADLRHIGHKYLCNKRQGQYGRGKSRFIDDFHMLELIHDLVYGRGNRTVIRSLQVLSIDAVNAKLFMLLQLERFVYSRHRLKQSLM